MLPGNILHLRAKGIWPENEVAMEWLDQLRISSVERTLAGLDSFARRSRRVTETPRHLLTGIEGEEAAYFYLRRKGYTIVARRWSSGTSPGDIDLIAWQGPLLSIVEVKTRTAHNVAPAEAAVDSQKRQVLRRLARQYVRQLPHATAPQVRFDVISVYLVPGQKREFLHLENAFGWNERRQDWE